MPPREGSDVGCNKIPAERGNGMQRGLSSEPREMWFSLFSKRQLDSRFVLWMRQRLHFFLIDFDFARLLHLIAHVVHKQSEEFLLLALQQLLANLVALGGEVGIRRRLHFEQRKHHSVPSAVY